MTECQTYSGVSCKAKENRDADRAFVGGVWWAKCTEDSCFPLHALLEPLSIATMTQRYYSLLSSLFTESSCPEVFFKKNQHPVQKVKLSLLITNSLSITLHCQCIPKLKPSASTLWASAIFQYCSLHRHYKDVPWLPVWLLQPTNHVRINGA